MGVVRRTAVAVAATGLLFSSSLLAAQNPSLPPQASPTAQIQVEGTLEVLVSDFPNGSRMDHFLETRSGKLRISIPQGSTDLEGLTTGTRIRVHGRMVNNALELGGAGSVETMALAVPNTFGDQRVVVLLVNFNNTTAPYNWTLAQDVTFNQTNSFYKENSYQQTSLSGDVFGWFTIGMANNVCDNNQIASLADAAATAAGVNLNNYTRRVYAFPSNACTWWGLGTVGGNPSRAWINGSYQLKVVAHELGHNFGDYHAKSQPCDTTGCTLIEYGDDRDIMGQSGTGHFNAFQKERFGWLNYGASPSIQTVSSNGTYWIEPLQTAGTAPRALKILKSTTSGNTYYYVEVRSQTGYDAGYTPGVILHTGNDVDGNTSWQIDLDPASTAFDALLNAGQSYTDTTRGVTFTTISSDASGAWVTVDFGGGTQTCATAAPTVSVSPNSMVSTLPGVAVNYSLSVRNNDTTACSSSTFNLAAAIPSGWTWTGPASLSVAPGGTASAAVAITPALSATGTWDSTIQATRASAAGGSVIARIAVATSLNLSVSATGGTWYTLSATATTNGAPVSGATVNFSVRDPFGGVTNYSGVTNASGVATVSGHLKGKAPHGTYLVTASASSGNLTGSATTTFVY